MKKIIIITTLLFSCVAIYAQEPIKYHADIDVGYTLGVGAVPIDRFNLHSIQGVTFHECYSLGFGFGADFYQVGDETKVVAPLFLDLKVYYPQKQANSLFIGLSSGVGIRKGDVGLYLMPTLGIKARNLKIQVGYNIQRLSFSGAEVTLGGVQVILGFIL